MSRHTDTEHQAGTADALIRGGCFCGAVRYEASEAPFGSMICHCRSCRRIAAAPAVAWVTFRLPALRFTLGQPQSLESSPGIRRRFCGQCGTQLSYENARTPHEIDLTTCSLDEPERFAPTHHSWLQHDLPWLHFGDGLPAYPQSRPAVS